MKSKELIKFCESKLGVNYVYGMKGEVMTTGKYNMLKSMYPVQVWDSDKKKIGTVCVDCSGLISWATGVAKNSSALKAEAPKLYEMSVIGTAPAGAVLWKPGHVGVYTGGGMCIEAKGSSYGVVRTKVSATKWEKWFLPKYIDYTDSEVKTSDSNEGNTSTSKSENVSSQSSIQADAETSQYIVTAAQSLNVRKGSGTSFEVVATVHKNDVLNVSKTENGWAYVPAQKGWCSLSYLKKVQSNMPSTVQNTGKAENTQSNKEPQGINVKPGDNVTVSGKLYSNKNGGNSIVKKNADMIIVSMMSSGKYSIAFAKKGSKIINGYGDISVITEVK